MLCLAAFEDQLTGEEKLSQDELWIGVGEIRSFAQKKHLWQTS